MWLLIVKTSEPVAAETAQATATMPGAKFALILRTPIKFEFILVLKDHKYNVRIMGVPKFPVDFEDDFEDTH